jgi:hypothetical protein
MCRLELNQAREFVARVIIVIPKVVRSLVTLPPLLEAGRPDTENDCGVEGVEHRIVFGNFDRLSGFQPPQTVRYLGDPGSGGYWFSYRLVGLRFGGIVGVGDFSGAAFRNLRELRWG